MLQATSSGDSYASDDDLHLGVEEFMDERDLNDSVVVDDDSMNNDNDGDDNNTYHSDNESDSAGSIAKYHKKWPSANEQNDYMEDKGWEDWDDDHRRALGKAHQRTLETLEEASVKRSDYSRVSMLGAMSLPSRKDPKGQILPRRYSSHEYDAKKRSSYHDDRYNPVKPPKSYKHYTFVNRNCILLTAVCFLCLIALICLQHFVILPPGTISGNIVRNSNDGKIKGHHHVSGGIAPNDIDSPSNPVDDIDFVPLVNRNTQVIKFEDLESESLSLFGVLRKLAFLIGNYFAPMQEQQPTTQTKTVLTIQDLQLLTRIQDELPKYENLYSSVDEPISDIQPVLWDIERSGSGTLKQILTYCFKLTLSSEMAIGHEESQYLEIYTTEDNTGHYANVNTETIEGLRRAQSVGLVDSNLVQVVATHYPAVASQLFVDVTRSGRVFTMLRHPVEQAHSNFLYRQSTLPEGHPAKLPEEMSLGQFVESDLMPTNLVTKALLNITDSDGIVLTDLHILGAQKILEDHVLVGLLDSFDESIHMYAKYFGWRGGDTTAVNAASIPSNQGIVDPVCIANFEASRNLRYAHEQLTDESSLEWKTIADRNYADMQLYVFAQSLYERQKELLSMGNNDNLI